MANSKKTGTRHDKFTPASIEAAKKAAIGLGLYLNYKTSFCSKCQKDKPKQGFSKRRSLLICADCSVSAEADAKEKSTVQAQSGSALHRPSCCGYRRGAVIFEIRVIDSSTGAVVTTVSKSGTKASAERLELEVLDRIDRDRYHTDLIELKAAFAAFDEQRSAK